MIGISIIATSAGLLAMIFTGYGALRRWQPDRVARLSLGGTVLGGLLGAGGF